MHQGITSQPWHQPARGMKWDWNSPPGVPRALVLNGSLPAHIVQVLSEELHRRRPMVSLERFIPKSDSTGSNWPTFLSYTHYSLRPDAMCWWKVIFLQAMSLSNVPPLSVFRETQQEINRRSNSHAAGKMTFSHRSIQILMLCKRRK